MTKPSSLIEPLIALPAGVFRALALTRRAAYDRGFLRTIDVGVPVISIGNITAGGTGKTPLTAMVVDDLKKRGISSAIVSRGYGGTETGPIRVGSGGQRDVARRFGDEPAWLAARDPDTPVFIGADRVAAALMAIRDVQPKVIVADDAFQHRRLHRSMDVVVLDSTQPTWHYRPLPLGRAREDLSSMRRAQSVFITKINLAPVEQLTWLRKTIGAFRERTGFSVFEFESAIAGYYPLEKGPACLESQSDLRKARVLLVSGIGRPHTFEELVRKSGADIAEHMIFRDHHS
ncbi:MAG TPA: tetraacyldisaccharide 4'-kinase, partial [Bdellovibrionales bacterium]|nr:tetraacyldisaccharide 4'-kinase [Bdellovibrionales bacterium]